MDIESVGHLMFGRGLRLRVAAWILGHGVDQAFYQGEAAQGVGYSASAVTTELERLVELQMLSKHEPTAGERRVYYTPAGNHPLWEAFGVALAAIDRDDARDVAEA